MPRQGLDVVGNAKATGKLRAQSRKTKEVLSANAEMPIKVNSLMDEKDHAFTWTRSLLEELAAPLLARVTAPIDRALAMAGLERGDLTAVEMLGGGQRIPAVQARLQAYFGEGTPLGVHLNADEAPALGAAFAAANISTAFKVRKTGMVDYSPFPVGVALKSLPAPGEAPGVLGSLFAAKKTPAEEAAEAEAMAWSKSTTVFKAWSRLDSKKSIAFHHDHDIHLSLAYAEPAEGEADLLPAGTPKALG